MPLSRAINHAHPATSNLFQDLIIPQKPIRVVTIDLAKQVIQSRFGRRMLAVAVNARGEKAVQTKAAPHARRGSALCADARFSLEMQGNRTGRTHEEGTSINRSSTITSANSQIVQTYVQRSAYRKHAAANRNSH